MKPRPPHPAAATRPSTTRSSSASGIGLWRKAPAPRYTRGVLAKFARLASTASKGAVTD